RHDDDARGVADARLQGDERVVDDENRRLVPDPVHDPAHDVLILGTIDTGNAQTDRRWQDALAGQGGLHHAVELFFEGQLADALEIRAGLAHPGDDRSIVVREQTDRLGAPDVDAQNVHSDILRCNDRA